MPVVGFARLHPPPIKSIETEPERTSRFAMRNAIFDGNTTVRVRFCAAFKANRT
jgi:hypothetical protein